MRLSGAVDAGLLFLLRAVFDLFTWITVGALWLLEISPVLALVGGIAALVWWVR